MIESDCPFAPGTRLRTLWLAWLRAGCKGAEPRPGDREGHPIRRRSEIEPAVAGWQEPVSPTHRHVIRTSPRED